MSRNASSPLHIVLALAVLMLFALLHAGILPLASFLERLEFANLDLFFKVRGAISPGERIVIVAIDDASFQRYGAWPWPRKRIAELVQRITEANADLIVCDFILHDKPADSAGTAALAQAMNHARDAQGRSRILLPYYFSGFNQSSPNTRIEVPEAVASSALILFDAPQALAAAPIPAAAQLFYSTPSLLAASLPGGHINILAEGETVRWENHLIRYGEAYLPSLPLQVALHAQRLTRGEVRVKAGNEIQLGKISVPLDAQGRGLINYYGAERAFPLISAAEIFESAATQRLANKIVFLGVTAAGTQDFLRTPMSARMPGVEKLATSAANILREETLVRQTHVLAFELPAMALLAALVFWAGMKWPGPYAGVLLFGLGLALWVTAFGFFASADLWLKPAGLILTTTLAGMIGMTARTRAHSPYFDKTLVEETPRRLGRYEVVREIGEGAMGKIYEGRDPTINRRAAIKTIRPLTGLSASSNARMRQRFLHEAQAAGALSHPNIVTIYEADEAGPYSYIAMEYLEGKTFEEVIEREAPLPMERIVKLLRPVCEALAYAHERGVVHRDVKPSNLMFTDEGVVKLMDFGIAHIFSSSLTQEGALLGTPNYMSPEQIRGEKVDGRSDIFALGVVAYEMATRQRPFLGESMATISHRIVSAAAIPPSELNPKLPEEFDEAIAKALRKAREERYHDAREFALALERTA
jgi:CHASE2 domain-containing sensor protein/predicted Ser/Thr protein kinase